MAKKTVATLQTGSKKLTKAIKMIRGKSNAYVFSEKMLPSDHVNDWLSKNKYFTFVTR